jgi:hypothetical protein
MFRSSSSSVVTQRSGSRFLQDNVLVFCFSIKSSYYQIIFSMFSLQSHEHTFWIILGSPWFGLFSIMDATGSYFSTPATAGSLHLADNWYLSTSWFFFEKLHILISRLHKISCMHDQPLTTSLHCSDIVFLSWKIWPINRINIQCTLLIIMSLLWPLCKVFA